MAMDRNKTIPIDFVQLYIGDRTTLAPEDEEGHFIDAMRDEFNLMTKAWEMYKKWSLKTKIKWVDKRIEVEDEDPNYYDPHFPREQHYIPSHYEIEYFPTCGNCGADMQLGYKFCPYCGAELEWTKKPQKIVEVVDHSHWEEEEKKRKEDLKFLTEELDKIKENEQ